MDNELRIMIAAGGTGGHVFPAIAIADAIREEMESSRFLFVGTRARMEWRAVPAAGYEIAPVWISGLHRRLTLKNLLFPLKLIVSLFQSWKLIRRFRPHAMISCGGFAAGPAGWMAIRMGIPLFIQEQNSYPGVTNRKLASGARRIFIAFDEARPWFPDGKTVLAGNPVRRQLIGKLADPSFPDAARKQFHFDGERPVLLVMGGSGGAKSINEAMLKHLDTFLGADGIQVIWQCGDAYLDDILKKLQSEPGDDVRRDGLRLYGFLDDITSAWAAADVIVSRAGAITCSELLATGKAGILVPSPHVAGDHQTHNAKALARHGAAVLLQDKDLTEKLPDTVRMLVNDPSKRRDIEQKARAMAKEEAAKEIAKSIIGCLRDSGDHRDDGNPASPYQSDSKS